MSPSIDTRENREFASEVKFLIMRSVAQQIHDWARAWLAPDPHVAEASGDGYQVTSLYFDTSHFDVFHRRGSYGRSKYRIRRYGLGQTAFLERKLKTRGLVSKRRSQVKLADLAQLRGDQAQPGWSGCWYHQRLLVRRLCPVCQITYRRTARVAMTALGPIRLTLDEGIQCQPTHGLMFQNREGTAIMPANQVILELKYRQEMPALFKRLAELFLLNPAPISKYRMALTALGFVQEPMKSDASLPASKEPLCLTS
jgi:hypothetical protein